VICFNHEGFLGPNEEWPPMFDQFEHPKEFEVVGIVVLFGRGEGG